MIKDYAPHMREVDAGVKADALAIKLLIATLTAITIFFIIATIKIASASTDEVNTLRLELVQNLAISPDAADYMHKQGSGLIFDDMEVE